MIRLAALAYLFAAAPALAHDGHDHGAGWSLDLAVILPLALAALLYAMGAWRLWRRSIRGRDLLWRGIRLYALGWLTLAGALVSPLHQAGERSFTLHMVEHELLMLVAALLLVAARPGAVFLWAFPPTLRRALGGASRWLVWPVLTDPFVATAIQAVALVGWHVPWLFDLALRHEAWHVVQHLSFILSALLFWWAMIHRRGRSGALVSALCLFVTSMVGGGVGALMSLASSPWYEAYAVLGTTPAGLTPQQDQQLAGLLMWIPGGLYHLAAALWFLGRAFRDGAAPTGLRTGHAPDPL